MPRHAVSWTLALLVLLSASLPSSVSANGGTYSLIPGDTIEYYLTNNTAGMWSAHSVRVQLTSIDTVYDAQPGDYVTRPLFSCESKNVWEPTIPPETWVVAGARINETSRIFTIPVGIQPQVFMLPLPLNISTIDASIIASLPATPVSTRGAGQVLQYTYQVNGESQDLEFAFNQNGILAQYHFRNATLTLSYTMVSAAGDFPFIPVISFTTFFMAVYLILKKNRRKRGN